MSTALRLNVGCGAKLWPGFANSDINGHPGAEYLDLRERPYPYASASCSLVLASHVLFMGDEQNEGYAVGALGEVLAEFYRVLRPGGWLRVDDSYLRLYAPAWAHVPDPGGFPQHLRMSRDDFMQLLLDVGYDPVVCLPDAGRTRIPCSGATRTAILQNHHGHASVAFEGCKPRVGG